MKLSIIIPTYNSGSVIARALDSILFQSFEDYEILVMDGKSTDNTIGVVMNYHDDRIIVCSEPDKGIYDAMNKGVAKARGEWVYFLGSDDWLYNDNVLLDVFSNENINGYDVVYGEVEASHLSENNKGAWTIDAIEYNRCHQAIFYKRTFLIKTGGYNLKYPIYADYDLNLKWLLTSSYSHLYIGVVIAHFSEGGISGRRTDTSFNKDRDKLFLCRGWRKLSREQRRYYLRELMRKNSLGKECTELYSIIKRSVCKE